MKELLRVLRVGGRAGECHADYYWTVCYVYSDYAHCICILFVYATVLLIIAKNLFLSSIQHLPLLQVVQEYEVNIGGLRGVIFILEKQKGTTCGT